MKIVDCHAHVGWYTDGYHSPKEIWDAETSAGVNELTVSSTSICAELYKLAVREINDLQNLGGKCIHPILWITPRMLDGSCRWALPYMLNSGIQWKGVKMHWLSHRTWYYNNKLLQKALDVVRKLDVPLLLHTGETKETHPSNYLSICKDNPNMRVVLAHGRPPKETLKLLSECPNAMVDTSFMLVEWIRLFIDNGFADRLCFGTDIPINKIYWKNESTSDFIKRHLFELKSVTDAQQFAMIVQNNPYSKSK